MHPTAVRARAFVFRSYPLQSLISWAKDVRGWRTPQKTRSHQTCYADAVGDAVRRRATYQDVLDAPPHLVAEVLSGELHLQPRPHFRHARSTSRLLGLVSGPFDRGVGGPGGWIILVEPELHLAEDILVPDIAGWRRETMPQIPESAFATVRPDWACEVLSPSTEHIDRADKMPTYAREGVGHVWLVDPEIKTLEVFRLDGETYRLVTTLRNEQRCRIEPFEALEFELSELWSR